MKLINNGFVRDIDGTWFSTVGLDRIEINAMHIEYDNFWKIDGIWIVDGQECPVALDDNYEGIEEAQRVLDEMMNS